MDITYALRFVYGEQFFEPNNTNFQQMLFFLHISILSNGASEKIHIVRSDTCVLKNSVRLYLKIAENLHHVIPIYA